MAYEWRENMACVGTYKVLEGSNFLDQFEDVDIPFNKAANVKMGSLRYYPRTTTNPDIIELLGLQIGRRFLTLLMKVYTVKKENPQRTSADIIESIAAVFQDKDKTIKDLAEVVDDNIKFPDEA
ncbi:MAG TPA: hypothetical protein VEU32_02115 [Burkholderiales bacterium]|nr:hypothetical protein [Burkholderiales bacterium]